MIGSHRKLLSPLTMMLALAAILSMVPLAAQTSEQVDMLVRNNNLGVAFMEQLKFDDAAQQFAKNTEISSKFVPAFVNLGIAHFYRQDYESALSVFERALELDPKQIQAHFMSGLIYRNQDQVDEAIREFSLVSEQDPDEPTTNYFLGLLFSRQKRYDEAIEKLRRAIAGQPYNASARYNLAIALLRSGRREEGQQEMAAFRTLQGQFGTDTIGLQYREQGRHSFVIDNLSPYLPESVRPLPRNKVVFREVASAVGIRFTHSGGRRPLETLAGQEHERLTVPFVGSGLAFADYDGDGWTDLYCANAGGEATPGGLFHNKGDGTFEETTKSAGLAFSGRTMSGIWGDYDGDGSLDLYLINYGSNVLYRNQGDGTFKDVTSETGVGNGAWGVSGTFVDVDHDGDLDIFVANFSSADPAALDGKKFPEGFPGAPNALYRNNGDGTFTDIAGQAGVAGNSRSLAVVATDFDNSRDIDLLVVNHGSPNQLLSNMRDGTFRDVAAAANFGSPKTADVAVGDFNQDGLMDFLVGALVPKSSHLLAGQTGGKFKSVQLDEVLGGSLPDTIHQSEMLDFDNDGDLDLLLSGSSLFSEASQRAAGGLILLENVDGRFENVTRQAGLENLGSFEFRGVSVADFDNDGDLDFAVSVNGKTPLLLRNDGGNRNNWAQVRLVGSNSNKQGIGTKVEILSGRHWQKMEVAGGNGFLGQSPSVIHFGLGERTSLDAIRLLWPGGVLQSEIDSPGNQQIRITELDRKGTSCPILYVWDGDSYQFVTDFLGGSAFGSLVSPGKFNYPDTDEYIKLDRRDLRLKDGKVAITLNNQLEEVIYFDKVELVAVDHPVEYEIVPDEKLLPGPPYDPFRIFTVSDPRLPLRAVNGQGEDVLPEISRIDRVYPPLFKHLPFKGYADLHELVMDLGPLEAQRAILIMFAWIDYADSTSNLAASQAGIGLVPPYLQVRDSGGNWVTVIDRMGFPAGLPKPMTVDLSGKFLSDSREVRIVTNMRIHWDQILVETGEPRQDYRLSRVRPVSADLRFRGFPAFESPDGALPKVYDYQEVSLAAPWKVHIGGYTRFGDVLPLLKEVDDQYVITRSGDEIEALFELRDLPELPQGWVRDYLIYVDGFGKDMDINSATPDYVGPLPFHGMSTYPYGSDEVYPTTDAHLEYLRIWNTRFYDRWVPELKERPPLWTDPAIEALSPE